MYGFLSFCILNSILSLFPCYSQIVLTPALLTWGGRIELCKMPFTTRSSSWEVTALGKQKRNGLLLNTIWKDTCMVQLHVFGNTLSHKKAMSLVDIRLIFWHRNVLPDREPNIKTQSPTATQTWCEIAPCWWHVTNLPVVWNYATSFTTCTGPWIHYNICHFSARG